MRARLAWRCALPSLAAECTGADRPAAERTPAQQKVLRNILAVTHASESDVLRAVAGASLGLYIWAHLENGERNAVENARARYTGSDDDAALNAGVRRYAADPAAEALVARLGPTGRMKIPLLTIHPVHDRARVEEEWSLAELYRRMGTSDRLAQFFDDGTGHLTGPDDHAHHVRVAAAAIQSMFDWVTTAGRPTFESVAVHCNALPPSSPTDSCSGLLRDYRPPSIWTILPREGRDGILGPARALSVR